MPTVYRPFMLIAVLLFYDVMLIKRSVCFLMSPDAAAMLLRYATPLLFRHATLPLRQFQLYYDAMPRCCLSRSADAACYAMLLAALRAAHSRDGKSFSCRCCLTMIRAIYSAARSAIKAQQRSVYAEQRA